MDFSKIFFTTLLLLFCAAVDASPKTLYNSLDPSSIPQHLAYYDLYPDTPEGRKALSHAWKLLSNGKKQSGNLPTQTIATDTIQSLISLVNKPANQQTPILDSSEQQLIESLASHLPNRSLSGYYTKTELEMINLPHEEIDVAHGLFLTQMGEDNWQTIRSYEAMIDLMALQILTRVSLDSPPLEKIEAINTFIFNDMRFRFPPHSLYAKDIDHYTFLPFVLDSRQGVCLGVSILYLSIAQRLNLNLEAVIPPGHIYIRWKNGDHERNIETTARGIHLASEEYLSIETRALETKNNKEVIGLAHINQASVYLGEREFKKALESYRRAEPYLSNYLKLKELLGLSCILAGEEEEGRQLLEQVNGIIPDHSVIGNTLVEDYLNGMIQAEAIKTLFQRVDEDRDSILKKKEELEKNLQCFPKFRDGWCALATAWLQLHRSKEALSALKHYHDLDPQNPTVEYYLAAIYAQRIDYLNAWKHFDNCQMLLQKYQHVPKSLSELRKELNLHFPKAAFTDSLDLK